MIWTIVATSVNKLEIGVENGSSDLFEQGRPGSGPAYGTCSWYHNLSPLEAAGGGPEDVMVQFRRDGLRGGLTPLICLLAYLSDYKQRPLAQLLDWYDVQELPR